MWRAVKEAGLPHRSQSPVSMMMMSGTHMWVIITVSGTNSPVGCGRNGGEGPVMQHFFCSYLATAAAANGMTLPRLSCRLHIRSAVRGTVITTLIRGGRSGHSACGNVLLARGYGPAMNPAFSTFCIPAFMLLTKIRWEGAADGRSGAPCLYVHRLKAGIRPADLHMAQHNVPVSKTGQSVVRCLRLWLRWVFAGFYPTAARGVRAGSVPFVSACWCPTATAAGVAFEA
jgi:hypothetical protein